MLEASDAERQAAEPILVATLPSDLSTAEYACIDLCAETNKVWPAENVCVWYRRCPGAETEVFAMQEACPHAGISLMESDIEDFRSTDLGTSLKGPCIACPAHSFVFDAGSGRCLTNPSTPDARMHSARWKTWPPYYLCPLICSAAFPFDGSRATRGPPARAAAHTLRSWQVPGVGCGDTKAHRSLREPDALPAQQHAGAYITRGRQRHPACHGRTGAQAKVRRRVR